MSFGLMQAARRGSMSTASPFPPKPSRISTPASNLAEADQTHQAMSNRDVASADVASGAQVGAQAAHLAQKPLLEPSVTKPVVPIGTQEQAALAPDRSKINSPSTIAASFARQDLIITASAAKALTKLFSALAVEPGSGNEVPVVIREKVLSRLIKESHCLADRLSRVATPEGGQPSIYLRARMLQQAVEHISDQWVKMGELNSDHLYEVARAAFNGEVPGLNQEVVNLFQRAGEYTPADTEEISQARITEAVIRASWKLTEIVKRFDRADYDDSLAQDKGKGLHPFSYAREVPDVVRDLTHAVLAITKENKLQINALDIATTWTQNSIERAASLVGAEYKLVTDRSLRASFLNDLTSEAALGERCQQYEIIMQYIHRRARNNFIIIEKNALDVMSAKGYKRFLPKQSPASRAESSDQAAASTSIQRPDTNAPSSASANDAPPHQTPNTDSSNTGHADTTASHSSTEQTTRRRYDFSRFV